MVTSKTAGPECSYEMGVPLVAIHSFTFYLFTVCGRFFWLSVVMVYEGSEPLPPPTDTDYTYSPSAQSMKCWLLTE